MIRLKFFSSFCSSEIAMDNYLNLYGIENNNPHIKFVTDKSYTHACIINVAQPSLTIPKENVIGLASEPLNLLYPIFIRKNFIEYAKKHISKYYIGSVNNDLPRDIFIEHYPFQWHIPKQFIVPEATERKHIMAIIVSEKTYLPGHQYRHALVSELLNYNIDIHIWGRSSNIIYNDKRAKGMFENNSEVYDNYHFVVAIENSINNYYITEKFIDPLVKACVPIYLGASKIKKVFNYDSYHLLTGNLQQDVNKIIHIYTNYKNYLIKDFKPIQNEIFNGNAFLLPFLQKRLKN
tara:strand:- start:1026 stop:1901 length:876 start_codon:yes stop_codon:yes gene_type:complete